ncbi:MAG: hypothetical protein L0H84_11535 [Pseudonocardia sp.]|nr:hypothetical protein [Pseudonocardia sp.]
MSTATSDTVTVPAHRTRLVVRGHEIDALGHVPGTVYMQYESPSAALIRGDLDLEAHPP